MENTNIEWTDHTFNPWMGCTKVSPGCDHCYAERDMDHRLKRVQWGPQGERVRTVPANWRKPVAWNANHELFYATHGRRQRVFCASLADVFDNAVDPAWRRDMFALIEATPNLDWLLLTKRIGNVRSMVPVSWVTKGWPGNVWLGSSIVNQGEADRDIPKLLALPARVRFLSMEPLLGPVDLRFRIQPAFQGPVDWVIVGGESGPQARPMHPDWARSLRDQCAAAGVPFLFKQWGEWGPTWHEAHAHMGLDAPPDPAGSRSIAGTDVGVPPNMRTWPVVNVGKRLAGRVLDGRLHDGYPNVGAN
jgi:protein gp37